MRYVLLLAHPRGRSEQADRAGHPAFAGFEAYVTQHGQRLGSAGLAETDVATTVRHQDGRAVVTDGPFVETARTSEVVGGYYDVDLPDLDTAIAAAALLPPSYAVEIRPTVTVDGCEGA